MYPVPHHLYEDDFYGVGYGPYLPSSASVPQIRYPTPVPRIGYQAAAYDVPPPYPAPHYVQPYDEYRPPLVGRPVTPSFYGNGPRDPYQPYVVGQRVYYRSPNDYDDSYEPYDYDHTRPYDYDETPYGDYYDHHGPGYLSPYSSNIVEPPRKRPPHLPPKAPPKFGGRPPAPNGRPNHPPPQRPPQNRPPPNRPPPQNRPPPNRPPPGRPGAGRPPTSGKRSLSNPDASQRIRDLADLWTVTPTGHSIGSWEKKEKRTNTLEELCWIYDCFNDKGWKFWEYDNETKEALKKYINGQFVEAGTNTRSLNWDDWDTTKVKGHAEDFFGFLSDLLLYIFSDHQDNNYVVPSVPAGPVVPFNSPLNGTRKALCVGINYVGQNNALRGCANDVQRVSKWLKEKGFSTMRLMIDDGSNSTEPPTRDNIIAGMRWLVQGAKKGDSLFFHYSGHGSQTRDTSGKESDGKDETIVPVDYQSKGQIVDDTIFDILVKTLPAGVRLTSLMDCCHSGTGMDLPYVKSAKDNTKIDCEYTAELQGDVVLFSGCRDDQTSADAMQDNVGFGAMTDGFLKSVNGGSYNDVLNRLLNQLKGRYSQIPQVSMSRNLNLDTPFAV